MDDTFAILNVWKRSRRLAINIYEIFSNCNDQGIKNRITHAADSIPTNLAEGYEQNSGDDFVKLLLLASEACVELHTQLLVCENTSLINKEITSKLEQEILEISGILQGLVHHYNFDMDS